MDYSATSVATANQISAIRSSLSSITGRPTFVIGGGSSGVAATLISQLNTGLSKGG